MSDENVKINIKRCAKCGEISHSTLPVCADCKIELKDFQKLTNFLNNFNGNKDDLIWFIKSEIADRQSYIISMCEVASDMHKGIMYLKAPEGNLLAKEKIKEIDKLYGAMSIAKSRYGG